MGNVRLGMVVLLLVGGCAGTTTSGPTANAGGAEPAAGQPTPREKVSRTGPPPARWRKRLASPDLSSLQFTDLIAEEIRRVVPDVKVTLLRPLELKVKNYMGAEVKMGLHNAWQGCHDNPSLRESEARRIVDSLKGHLTGRRKPPKPSARTLVPLIKSSSYMAQIKQQTGGQMTPLAERLAGDLWVIYAMDMPDRVAIVSQKQGLAMGLDPVSRRALALKNLRRVLKPAKRHGKGPIFLITAGGMYESSMLLLDEFWPAQAQAVQGDVVAAVPNRDVLLFTGSKSKRGMANICKLIIKQGGGAYHISNMLLIRTNGVWRALHSCTPGKVDQ